MEFVGLFLLLLAAGPILFGMLHWYATVRVPDGAVPPGAVTLILPFAPPAPHWPRLAAALAAQSLAPRRLIIAVADAAHAPPPPGLLPCQMVVAGVADMRGQKSHNLLAALALVDADDDAVLFLDADIAPPSWWLAFLAGPILRRERDVVGGYRWSQPAGPVAQAVAWLDRGWALTARFPALGIAWGGSLAVAPASLPAIRQALGHGVSDDLAIASAARGAGLRLLIRGAALVPSPLESAGALEFWGRQLRILRFYRPRLWAVQMAQSHMVVLAWLLLWGHAALWLAVAAQALRGLAQDAAARRLGMADPPATRAAQAVLSLLPIADAVNLWCLWRSAFGRQIVWRGITYEVAPDGAARVVA